MTDILKHKLDILTLFGIDIENCKDETDVAEKIYDYYVGENQLEKLWVWAEELAEQCVACEGSRGINTWEKIDFVSHICTYIEGNMCTYEELQGVLENINN
jgi:hypothetical protein